MSTATLFKELCFNSLLKQSTGHDRPIVSTIIKFRADIIGNEYADSLARKSITTYSVLMYWVDHLLDILAPRCPKGD
jgi:hypothetical protein